MDIDTPSADRWSRIGPFCPEGEGSSDGYALNNRRVVDALIWMARSGTRGRDLPAQYDDHLTSSGRYYGWIEMGVLEIPGFSTKARARSPQRPRSSTSRILWVFGRRGCRTWRLPTLFTGLPSSIRTD